jgi:hypothetical protein
MEILLVIMVVTIIKFFHFINTNKEEKEMEIELAQEKRIAKLKADKEAEIAKYEAEVAEHAKHTTEKILDINTYQNNNLTNDDIMSTFKSQSLLYLKNTNIIFINMKYIKTMKGKTMLGIYEQKNTAIIYGLTN